MDVRAQFPYSKIKDSIARRYNTISRADLSHPIHYKAYQELLANKFNGNKNAYFSLQITLNGNRLHNVLYAITEDLIFVYCFEPFNEYSEPVECLLTGIPRETCRYTLEAVYELDKQTLNKLSILGGEEKLSPEDIFKLLHTDKVKRLT